MLTSALQKIVMIKLFMAIGSIAISLGTLPTEKAEAFSIFTSRADWSTAVSGNSIFIEDFSNFTVDTPFQTSPVDVGEFTLRSSSNFSSSTLNIIDVTPLNLPDVDGTNYALLYTDFGATTVDLTYDIPVVAWGADFANAATSEMLNLDLVMDMGGVFATIPVTVNDGFFGFVTDPIENIRQITFVSRINEPGIPGQIFGLDNVTAVPVPEPLTILGSGAALGIGVIMKRRHALKKAA
jgi:hypothetical protein